VKLSIDENPVDTVTTWKQSANPMTKNLKKKQPKETTKKILKAKGSSGKGREIGL
jgi:hypothetical protein